MKFLALLFAIMISSNSYAGDGHDHGENAFSNASFGSSFDLTNEAIKNLDIKTQKAQLDIFKESKELPCVIKNPPEQTSEVHTTYIGQIKHIYARVGDRVKKGQLLFSIFSMKAVRDLPITSPIDGIVSEQNVSIGQIVELESVLMEITSTKNFVAEGYAYLSDDINHIKRGDLTEIQIDGTHDNVIGLVERFSPQVNPTTKTKSIFIDFSSKDEHIYPNMHCRMTIFYGNEKNVIAVKKSAVLEANGEKFVFLKNGNHFEKVSVITGSQSGDTIEVKNLHVGDEVVTNGNYQLQYIPSQEPHDHEAEKAIDKSHDHEHTATEAHNEDDFAHDDKHDHDEKEAEHNHDHSKHNHEEEN